MMTSSNGNIFRVTGPLCGEFTGPGEFPTQRPVTRSFDVFFDLRLNKRLSKQPWGWWFEPPSWSLWRHRSDHIRVYDPLRDVVFLGARKMQDNHKTAKHYHYNDVIMGTAASRIPSLTIVFAIVYSGTYQRKHQSFASLAFVQGNSPVTGEFPVQRASNAENVSIWWLHHVTGLSAGFGRNLQQTHIQCCFVVTLFSKTIPTDIGDIYVHIIYSYITHHEEYTSRSGVSIILFRFDLTKLKHGKQAFWWDVLYVSCTITAQ